MKLRTASASLLVVLCCSAAAHADEAGLPTESAANELPPTDAAPPTWYGWQTLIVDAGVAGVGALAATDESRNGLGGLALGAYVLAAPMVHLAHSQGGRALVDVGVRVAAPLLLGAVPYAIGWAATPETTLCIDGVAQDGRGFGSCETETRVSNTVEAITFGGAALGFVGAVVFDAVWLAKEPSTKPKASSLRPTGHATSSGATFGVRGVF
jgi:hypothetical protein